MNKRFNIKKSLSILILGFTLLGCEAKPKNEIKEVHWDRDMCNRCTMVISDRKNAVQVVNQKDGKTYMFDDIGCVVTWFEDEKIEWKDSAKIWVNDNKTGEWIDARKAFYDDVTVTPMAFGFGAHKNKDDIKSKLLSFNELYAKVSKK